MSELDQDLLTEELDRLGEQAPTEDELSSVGLSLDDAVDVAMVAALAGLTEPLEDLELGEMSQARAWRKVEGRMGGAFAPPAATGAAQRRSWPMIAAGLAAAAAVTFIIVRPGIEPTGDEHEMAVALSVQARQGLTTLGVKPGGESARAQAMLRDYEARLGTADSDGSAG